MSLIKIGDTIINTQQLVSVLLDEPAQTLTIHMSAGQPLKLTWDDDAQAVYQWLVEQCLASFGANEKEIPLGLSQSAWTMLLRIERHEQRTELGLPIDDDDMKTKIELERKNYIRTDVHYAWLTKHGRSALAQHRAEQAGETVGEDS